MTRKIDRRKPFRKTGGGEVILGAAKIKMCPVQVHTAAEKETFLAIRSTACELLTVYRFR